MQANSKSGFSLLELLIVMAIVAILITVAYPLYTSHLIKARRNQAEIALLYLASQLESFYSVQNSYQGATLESLGVSAYDDDHTYQFVIQSVTDSNYTVSALPLAQQAQSDTQCEILTLNEQGERTVSGTLSASLCWI